MSKIYILIFRSFNPAEKQNKTTITIVQIYVSDYYILLNGKQKSTKLFTGRSAP